MQDEMTTVLLADDDPIQLAYLAALITRLRPEWKIVSQTLSLEQVEKDLAEFSPSLAILDVRFSDTTSLEIVRGLRESYPVIFVTGDPLFAADAFTCEALDFVLKPIKPERFEQALKKAEIYLLAQSGKGDSRRRVATSLRMIRGQELVWTPLTEVRYFEAHRKYTRVVLKNQEGLLKMGISTATQFLNPENFWRIHRGLVLNVSHMVAARRDEFGRMTIKIADRDENLVVSKSYEYLFRDGFS